MHMEKDVSIWSNFSLSIFLLSSLHCVTEQESTYHYRVIWRFLDVVSAATRNCRFKTGETRLGAIKNELIRHGLSTSSYYTADGIILEKDAGLELVLLETSGPYKLNDSTRETKDHIKAAYGLLAMLHTIAIKYLYADVEIFMKLNVYFVHVANERIRIWSFKLVDKELYVLNRIQTTHLSTDHSQCRENIMSITNSMWELKTLIDESCETIEEIKRSHEKNERMAKEPLPESAKVTTLDSFLVDNAEVKLSFCISNAEDIFVSSSPIRSCSPYSDDS